MPPDVVASRPSASVSLVSVERSLRFTVRQVCAGVDGAGRVEQQQGDADHQGRSQGADQDGQLLLARRAADQDSRS